MNGAIAEPLVSTIRPPKITIMPIGLVMRAFGKDFLRLKLDRNTSSYWIERTPPGPPPQSMRNQF